MKASSESLLIMFPQNMRSVSWRMGIVSMPSWRLLQSPKIVPRNRGTWGKLYVRYVSAYFAAYAGVGLGFSSSNRSISDTVQNIGLVLLAPSRPSANSTTNGSSPATLFRVVALNNSMQQDIFGQGHLPPNVTMNDSANSHVNVTLFYSGKPNDGQSFILDKNTSIASLQPKQGGTVTLNLKNTSNSTAYIGIYGPSGFTGGLVTALNNSGVVYNSNTTTWAPASTDTPAWNSSTLASTADTTTGPRSLFPWPREKSSKNGLRRHCCFCSWSSVRIEHKLVYNGWRSAIDCKRCVCELLVFAVVQ